MGSAFLRTLKSKNHCSHFHIKIPPPRDELSCGRLVAWPMSESHKGEPTLMSLTPLISAGAGPAHMDARARTLADTRVHTVLLSHAAANPPNWFQVSPLARTEGNPVRAGHPRPKGLRSVRRIAQTAERDVKTVGLTRIW